MKKKFFPLMAMLAFGQLSAVDPARLAGIHTENAPHYHEISTPELKQRIEKQGRHIVILDTRTKEYDDGRRIPGAKFFPYNSKDEEIALTIPKKDTLVVVYCTNSKCPASKFLADRLVVMGYTNVYKYGEGIEGWIKGGNPIEKGS